MYRVLSSVIFRDGSLIGVRSCRCFTKLSLTSYSIVCSSISQAADRPYTYVIFATKAIPELTRTPELLTPLLSEPYCTTYPQPTYVNVQNGLNVEVDLYKALQLLNPHEEPRIISTAAYVVTNMRSQTLVEHCNDWVSDPLRTLAALLC